MALLDDLLTALVNEGLVVTSEADWKIFLGYMPESPNRCVCVYETPGLAPEARWEVDYPDFQVKVRGNAEDYQAVRAKLQAIFDFLHSGQADVGAAYVSIDAKNSGPLSLGQDEQKRPSLVQNYRVTKTR